MTKIVKNPAKMSVSAKKSKDNKPNLNKIARAKKDMISEKVKGLKPGAGLGSYNLDVMILD